MTRGDTYQGKNCNNCNNAGVILEVPHTSFRILAYLAGLQGPRQGERFARSAYPSQGTIAAHLGRSRRHVNGEIGRLAKRGLLTVKKVKASNGWMRCTYRLTGSGWRIVKRGVAGIAAWGRGWFGRFQTMGNKYDIKNPYKVFRSRRGRNGEMFGVGTPPKRDQRPGPGIEIDQKQVQDVQQEAPASRSVALEALEKMRRLIGRG